MKLPLVILKSKKEHSIKRKHCWVFSGAIEGVSREIEHGELVRVVDSRGAYLATGMYQDFGSISVRIIDFTDTEIDQSWWNTKIKNAVDLRIHLNLLNQKNNIVRLVFAEGDGLPGLVVDYYNQTAVIQCHTVGMHHHINEISNALQAALGQQLLHVYNKSAATLKEVDGDIDGTVFGEPLSHTIALENEAKYNIDWVKGQKTGFFIDQRDNRTLLQQLSKGKRVLNTFCYSGGFSVAALKGGASSVVSLDSSAGALELTKENVALNGFSEEQHSVVQADAVEYIKDIGNSFDVVVLDPPAFAKNKSAKHKAVQAYKRLNLNALNQLKPGGLLFTFSCSQAVDKTLFNHTLTAAAIESGRTVKIIHQLHQPADHPINIYHPESEYLKGLVLQVI